MRSRASRLDFILRDTLYGMLREILLRLCSRRESITPNPLPTWNSTLSSPKSAFHQGPLWRYCCSISPTETLAPPYPCDGSSLNTTVPCILFKRFVSGTFQQAVNAVFTRIPAVFTKLFVVLLSLSKQICICLGIKPVSNIQFLNLGL